MYNLIKKIQLDDTHYIEIGYDTDQESPREWDNDTFFCIRPHLRYNFPNELDHTFDQEEDFDSILEWYHVFALDCYEHSGIKFSLHGTGMQCNFDTARDIGFVAVRKDTYPDYGDALVQVEKDLETYNQWLAGEIYHYDIYETFPPLEINGAIYRRDPEVIDSLNNIFDWENAYAYIQSQWHETIRKETKYL